MTRSALGRICAAATLGALVLAPGAAVAFGQARAAKEEGPAFVAFGDTAPPVSAEDAARALATVIPWGDYEGQEPGAAAAAAAEPAAPEAPAVSSELAAQLRPAYERALAAYREELAKTEPADAEQRKVLEKVIADTEASLAYLDGKGPLPGAGAAGAAADPGLKVPAVGATAPPFDVALEKLKKFLTDNASPEAIAAFEASPEARDARRSASAAAGALLVKRPLAAVAALLRAHALEPAEPTHLVSLAAVASRLGMPRHALALLARAEAMGGEIDAPLGVPGRAVLLVNRGYALVLINQLLEAEAALREAVRMAPQLSEARLNLAHALHRQDDKAKKAEAVRYYAVARRRTATTPAQAASPPPAPPEAPGVAEPPADGPAMSAAQLEAEAVRVRAGRPPAAAVFDMSRGKSHTLPLFKVPRSVAEAAAADESLKKFRDELMAKVEGYTERQNELYEIMREREAVGAIPRASADRARAVFWYITHAETEPSFRKVFATKHKAAMDRGNGSFGGQLTNPYGSHELMKKHDAILAASMSFEETCKAMQAATEPYHGSWQGPIRNLYNEVGQYSQKEYRYQTALAANLADPVHHEYAVLLIKVGAIMRFQEVLGPTLIVTNWCKHHADSWKFPPADKVEAASEEGEYPDADVCPHALKGNFKVKASFKVLEISGNCEKIGLELSAGEWVKLFGEVEYKFEGEYGIFIGVAAEASIPGAPVTPEAAVKSGLFITIGADGQIEDFGFKRTEAKGVAVGYGDVSIGYEEEIETEYGIMATLAGD